MARVPVRMPKMSMTMTEGELSSWALTVGDSVQAGDVICEVLTDKVDMEVESPATGTLVEITVQSGTVPVGEPIGWIEAEGDSFTDLLDFGDGDGAEPAASGDDLDGGVPAAPSPPTSGNGGAPKVPAPSSGGPIPAVPRARAMARQAGLDLASVTATGPAGVVSVRDVETALAAAPPPPARRLSPPQRKRAAAEAARAAAAAAVPQQAAVQPAAGGDKVAAVRRAVARKMTESAAVPQFTVWRDLHLDTADAHRDGLSWTTVLLQAYARSLRRIPRLLTRWDGERAVETGPPSVALAVDSEHGLMVPVFVEPDTVNPRRLDEDVRATAAAARLGKVDAEHLGAANSSLSNLGGLGVDRFQALVTPPQASVLALGAIARRPVAVPGGLGTALVVTAGLTVDHRVADGADGARLLDLMAADLG